MTANKNGHTNIACNYRSLPVGFPGCICNRKMGATKEEKTENVWLRITPQEKRDWKLAAKATGRSMSDFVRKAMRERLS
jgi:hypothetical protein